MHHSDGNRLGGRKERHSDGGLGEGDSKMVIFSEIVVVELNQGLNSLLH